MGWEAAEHGNSRVVFQDWEHAVSAECSRAPTTMQQRGEYFPGLGAGPKGNGKGPKADGAMAVRATPEPASAFQGRGGQVTNVLVGTADP
jgi:hypothetical protein